MNNKFKENLKELRIEKALKQSELALILKVSKSTISGWEIGRNEPNYDMLIEIVNFFGITIDELISK